MAKALKRSKKSQELTRELRGQLLEWYDRHRRQLPWRALEGQRADPYHVWLSEIMLQQTTVTAVKPYYTKFLEKWPTVHDLAAADNDAVMAAWAGLGYYARARNLHKCAKVVSEDLGGTFPEGQAELKKLPGIGDYTSAAISAIAFNKPATVMDGNVERVIARLFNIRDPLPASKATLKSYAHEFFDGFEGHPGDLAQAFMDLGATICIPKAPRCSSLCPLKQNCTAPDPAALPMKSKKKPRPQKYGAVYWIENDKGEVLLHKRPNEGLLGGCLALPTSEWLTDEKHIEGPEFIKSAAPYNKLKVKHVFTHFDLELSLYSAQLGGIPDERYIWMSSEGRAEEMPSVFSKAYKLFL